MLKTDVIGNMVKQRIEYIDLMKGLCIFSIVALHFNLLKGNSLIDNMVGAIGIPLYFFLSGVFFKTYNDFTDLLIRKINNLLIPLLFFSLCFFIIGFIVNIISKGLLFHEIHFSNLLFNNYPLWFLKALFFSNLIYYFIIKFIHNDIMRTILCLLLAYLGVYLSDYNSYIVIFINKHICIINAIIGLFFMHIGYLSNKYNFINIHISNTKFYALILLLFITLIYFSKGNTDFFQAKYNINFLFFIIASISGIYLILFISKKINRLIIFSYLGRYSLIVLGSHFIIQSISSPIFYYFIPYKSTADLISFIITIIFIRYIGINFFINLFPQFTAQKNLLNNKN